MIDGELVVTGRVKEILFVAGQNHYPQDIELVLAQHAGIELGRAAAAGTRPPHAATDDVLVFVLHKGDDLAAFAQTARTMRRVVNERMGLPVAAVIPVRQFPKTTSGKIQRFALARDFEDGRFADVLRELDALDARSRRRRPSSDLEQTLLAICQAALPNRKLVARRQPVRARHRLAHARADLREGRGDVSRATSKSPISSSTRRCARWRRSWRSDKRGTRRGR